VNNIETRLPGEYEQIQPSGFYGCPEIFVNGVSQMQREKVTLDANEAVADIAYKLSEVIAIFPITPSSTMGEWSDQWAGYKLPNLWWYCSLRSRNAV
jgi:hypothetical protein